MAIQIFSLRAVLCFIFLLATVGIVTAQDTEAPAEDFAQFHITVKKKADKEPVPINYAGVLNAGDKLFINVDETYTDSKGIPIAFNDLSYKKIAVLFVPMQVVLLPKMKLNKDATYQERNLCTSNWAPCQSPFEFTAPYPSFPMVFLVSKKGYKDQLVKLVTKDNFNAIVKSSGVPYHVHLAEQKLEFLTELVDVLNVKKLESRKVLHALFEAAKSRFKLFDETGCEDKGKKDAEEEATKNKPGSTPTQSDIYKKQLGCLIKDSDAALKAFANLRNSGAFDVKSVVYLLANTALNLFIDKFPSLGIYFTVAKLALIIIQEIFKQDPLDVSSIFVSPAKQFGSFFLLSAPPTTRITADTIKNSGITDKKEVDKLASAPSETPPPSNSERAIFFLPMQLFGGLKFTDQELAAMKPEPKVPCVTKGDNGWGLDDKLLGDPLLRDLSVTLFSTEGDGTTEENAQQKIVFDGMKTKNASGFVSVTITDEQWNDISIWNKPQGTIKFNYGNIPVVLKFDAPKAEMVNVEFTPDSLFKFRRGSNARLVFKSKASIPNCVDKVIYTFNNSTKVEDLDTFQTLDLTAAETESMEAGTGKIEFQQFGNDQMSTASKIKLLDHMPSITSIKASEADGFAVVQGAQLTEFPKASGAQYDLVYVDDTDAETGIPMKFTFSPSSATEGIIRLTENRTFPAQGSRFKVKMRVPGGEPIQSPSVSVISAARPVFETSTDCIVGEDKSRILTFVNSIDENSPFDLGPCVSSIATPTLSLILKKPEGTTYRFANGQQYPVLVTAVRKAGDERNANAITHMTDATSNTRSAVLKLPIANGQFEPIRDITDEGTVIRIKLLDSLRGESDWYTLGQEFVSLPANLLLDCSANNLCRLSGNLSGLDQVAVAENQNHEPLWNEVGNIAAGGVLTLPLISIPKPADGSPYYFYIKTLGSSRPIKVKFLPNNTSFVYKAATSVNVLMAPIK